MSTHYSKQDLKKTDIVTQELKKGFQWSTKHSTTVIGLSIGFIVLGLGWSVWQYFADQAEVKAQESYFKAEKIFLKQKESFDKYAQTSAQVAEFQKNKPAKKSKTDRPEPKVEGQASTGDFDKDYGVQAKELEQVVSQFPDSHAAQMAALTLSEVQIQYKKADSALGLLNKVKVKNDLLSGLVLLQKGTALSAKNDCKAALDVWGQVLQMKNVPFLAPEVHLKQGLCFEATGDKVKAEESYNKVMAEAKDSPLARSAEQYIRLLKVGL